jgi:G2/mitotic-specific cyclin-B, other
VVAAQPAVGAKAPAGRSMSQALEARSDVVVSAGKIARTGPAPLPDIDEADRDDPLTAAEYVNDIFRYYQRVEPTLRVGTDYMAKQNDINDKMRAILIDWLVDVHLKFKLMPETLYLTTNLIDRFLEVKAVSRKHLQLVGVTAMLIASKYEEIWAPEVRDFVYISDRAYNRDQILQMEKIMLNSLGFNLTVPTPYPFLNRFLKAACVGRREVRLPLGFL